MVSKMVMTRRARLHLRKYVEYILRTFNSKQAAKAVTSDAARTKEELVLVADSLAYCDDPDLKRLGYRTIHFRSHQYFFVYEVRNDTAFIEAVYHDLQNYEQLFKHEVLGI